MLEGDLKNLPFNDLLQVLASGQKTGVLTVTKKGAQARLYLRRGRLEQAQVRPGAHLGELLVKMDLLTTFEVQTLLAQQEHTDPGVGLGLLAVAAECLNVDGLKRALKAQILEVLTDLAGWRSGRFSFGEYPLGAAQPPSDYSFDTGFLLMEAVGRVDAWQQGVSPERVLERVGDPTQASLPHSSWELLGHVDGRRSARTVAAEVDLPSAEVYHLLHRLETEGVVAPARYPGEASNALVLSANEALQRLIALSLQRANFTVFKADTTAAGLELVQQRRPHVIVVDDEGEGWAFVRALRGLTGRSHLPVVLLSNPGHGGAPNPGAPRTGLFGRFKRPHAHTLQKPFHELELQQLVIRVVGRQLA